MTALNLSQAIVEFWQNRLIAARLSNDPETAARFTANDLRHYVNVRNFGTAPASADRIMRNLRKAKKINYVLTNRAKSLYTAIPLEVNSGK